MIKAHIAHSMRFYTSAYQMTSQCLPFTHLVLTPFHLLLGRVVPVAQPVPRLPWRPVVPWPPYPRLPRPSQGPPLLRCLRLCRYIPSDPSARENPAVLLVRPARLDPFHPELLEVPG